MTPSVGLPWVQAGCSGARSSRSEDWEPRHPALEHFGMWTVPQAMVGNCDHPLLAVGDTL